jgi:Tol biopolymer transport system component
VVAVETGAIVPFEIKVSWPPSASSQVNFGRARWTPDGKRILFIGADAEGRAGVYVQDFVPGQDTSASRRAVTGLRPTSTPSRSASRRMGALWWWPPCTSSRA